MSSYLKVRFLKSLFPILLISTQFPRVIQWFIVTYLCGQVSAWQSATLLPISCNSVQPVPAWVKEPVSPVSHSCSSGVTIHEQSTLSQNALRQHGKVGCQNWQFTTTEYSAAGGEHDQHTDLKWSLGTFNDPSHPLIFVSIVSIYIFHNKSY